MGPWVRGDDRRLLHLFVGVNAPQTLLLYPAVKTVAWRTAPAVDAFLYLRHHAGLQPRRDCAAGVGTVIDRREFFPRFHRYHRGAAAGQHGVIDPALGAFGIAHPAPVLEFGGDLDRQTPAGINPGHAIVLGRAG